jgi:hypothetical protein
MYVCVAKEMLTIRRVGAWKAKMNCMRAALATNADNQVVAEIAEWTKLVLIVNILCRTVGLYVVLTVCYSLDERSVFVVDCSACSAT